MLLGIDTGGTFTDFVLVTGDEIRVHKVQSDPRAPDVAIMRGIRDLGLLTEKLKIVHGTTVATNAVLEGKTAVTAYITNRGFADLLTIGRQNRDRLYDLKPVKKTPPVPASLCFETGGRLAATGELLEPLDPDQLRQLVESIAAAGVEAVAINLLFSYLDPSSEHAIAEALPDSMAVSRSSEVLAEYREYERGIATWLNATVAPLLGGYFSRLGKQVGEDSLFIMQSAGETLAAPDAERAGVNLLLSGPAGGLAAAAWMGRQMGVQRLLTLDMGGTSTDVAMVDGGVTLTTEGRIGDYPVAVPMVDMHTIGAGGGSIAWVDAGGLLHVGPESAGASPGPACYGQGGRAATVTDANLVLGRLAADQFLGGEMALQPDLAWQALERLGARLNLDARQAAEGVISVANEKMAAALRVISAERGHLPADFSLMSFGGAGGQHVCALAEALAIATAIVPRNAGVLSAMGMLVARPGRRVSQSVMMEVATADVAILDGIYTALENKARQLLQREGISETEMTVRRQADLRYLGQSHALLLDWQTPGKLAEAFHCEHESLYGHRLDRGIEIVTLRVAVQGPEPVISQQQIMGGDASQAAARPAGERANMPIWHRDQLVPGWSTIGPILITETVSTTYVAPGWRASLDAGGNIVLQRGSRENV